MSVVKYKLYRKKPVIIQAKQMDEPFTTQTMEGTLNGKVGDYLIIGVKGEQYPCDKKIFEETYEEVSDDEVREQLIKNRPDLPPPKHRWRKKKDSIRG